MKPTTQAKTINQFTNQIGALEEILDAAIAGSIQLGLTNNRVTNHEAGAPCLHQALMEAQRAIAVAHNIAVSANTDVVRAKQKERNGKYKYLREEYYAKKTDNSFSRAKALQSAAEGRRRLKDYQDLKVKNKRECDAVHQQVEADKAGIKLEG